MYIHDFLCTYKSHDEKDQDDIYRAQFLQAFGLKKWNDRKIERKTKELFDAITSKQDISEIIEKIKQTDKFKYILQFLDKDDYDLFKLLFIFDLFDLAHRCFCDILTINKFNIDNKNMLLNNI